MGVIHSREADDEIEEEQIQYDIDEDEIEVSKLPPGIRGKIYVLMTQPSSSKLALMWSVTMMGFIITSIVVFCVQTLPPFYSDNPGHPWSTIEIIISVVFTIDLLLRMLTCGDIKNFMKDPFTAIDILSILPFYIGLMIPARVSGLKVIRVVRLIRIFRVFRLGRYSSSIIVVVQTFYLSRHILFSALTVLMFVVTFFSTMIYYAERGEWSKESNFWMQDGEKSNIQDVSQSLWMVIITMTTVGYGDITPITRTGRILGSIAIFLGTVGVGFTITIISSNFASEWDSFKRSTRGKLIASAETSEEVEEKTLDLNRRQKVYQIFTNPNSSKLALCVSAFMFATVVFSIILFLMSTVEPFNTNNKTTLFILDTIVIVIFIVDFIARFSTTDNRIVFMKDGFNVIDLLTIFPYFLDLLSTNSTKGLIILRVLRLVRIFRVLRLGKYSQDFTIVFKTIKNSKSEILLLLFILPIVLVLSSSIMYYIERGDYIDGQFCSEHSDTICIKSQFNSVVATFWWCIQTISTLGYGDMVPKTLIGRIWGSSIALFGLMVIAFPVAVLGNNFASEWQKKPPSKIIEKITTARKAVVDEKAEDKLKASQLPIYHPRKIHYTFKDPGFSGAASVIQKMYMCVIAISVFTTCYSSLDASQETEGTMWYVETIIVSLFTWEYVATTLFSDNVIRSSLKLSSIIDLCSIVPYYVGLVPGINAPSLSILRVVRLFRLFKIYKHSKYSTIFKFVQFSVKKNVDVLLLLLFVMCIEVILTSSVMFYAERGSYEDGKGWYINGRRSSFQNVPETFWWSIVTLCTVGYGDYLPVTWLGKLIAGLTVILGILTMAFPITIICNTFCEEWLKYMQSKKSRRKSMVSSVPEEQTPPCKTHEGVKAYGCRKSGSGIVRLFNRLTKVKTRYVDFIFLNTTHATSDWIVYTQTDPILRDDITKAPKKHRSMKHQYQHITENIIP